MDYEALGLRCGLEIHQQLDTHKLFCNCKSELRDEVRFEFRRRLRTVLSELGGVDSAALAEKEKNLQFCYQVTDTSCSIEADESPPREPNKEALRIGLLVSLLFDATPIAEINFMRKIVIDGSNTTGFQRTALIAKNGIIKNRLGEVGIDLFCIEEDACRRIDTKEKEITFRLDRLGIPLIEITTRPEIKTPTHAFEIAKTIGAYIRATGKVKRGLGTIRQDLNISIKNGARVELKGVQNLKAFPEIIDTEIKRELALLELK